MLFAFLKLDNQALFTSLRNQGFKAVSDKHWQKLVNAIKLLESNDLAHFKIRQAIKRLEEQAVKSPSASLVNAVLQLSQWIKPTYFAWQKKQIALFNNPAWWEKRLAAANQLEQPARNKAIQTIPFLRQLWEQQNHYALYSTLDLIHVYETVFPLFSEWLIYAQTELQHKKQQLSQPLLRQYEAYLSHVKATIEAEKRQVRLAFKARLVAGVTQQNVQFEEVISLMQAELYALDVLPMENRSPNEDYSGYLTPPVWLKMQHLIEQEGSEAEKVDWYSLSYNAHRNPTDLLFYEHYRSTHQGHTYRIPSEFAFSLPLNPPFYLILPHFLHWFFITDRFYYTFFQHPTCQYVLAIEQSFEQWKCPAKVSLATLEKNQAWQGLQNLWEHLAAEKTRIENIQKNVFIFARREIVSLLEKYHKHLEAFANEIVLKQIALMNEAMKPFHQKNLTDNEKHRLEQLLQVLQSTEKTWPRTANVKIELTQLILHCHHLLNRPVVTTETLEAATIAIDALNKGEKLTSDALDAIKTTQNSLALSECVTEANRYTQARFTIKTSLAKEKIPDLLKAELLENPLQKDQETVTLHLQKLKTYHPWILRETPPLMDPVILNDQLCYYTYIFLQSVYELPSKQTFLAKNAVLKQVIGTLQYLTETTFSALHCTLTPLMKININQPVYTDDWQLFRQCELLPPLNTLKKYLTDRGLEQHLHHALTTTNQPESENMQTFNKVFSATKTSASQTDSISFNPTFHQ